jgi:phosphatidylserine/phosphatidylglycerophosphate/cardiolipin synthase-like enzyme
MTMYELTAPDVIAAMIARHRAGIDVRAVLNADFAPSSTNFNQSAFSKLTAAGISVVWAPTTFTFTHEKCVVIDGASAWIMTMNATKTSATQNREYLAVDTIAADVAEAEAQFAADFTHQSYTPAGNLLVAPVNARSGLATLFGSAQQTIDFEVEELSDPGVATELCAAAARHVTVRGALSTQAPSLAGQHAQQQLKSCGVPLVTFSKLTLHAKAVVVDGARAYVGSANFSTTSLDQNRELALVTNVATAVATVKTTIDADIAAGSAL